MSKLDQPQCDCHALLARACIFEFAYLYGKGLPFGASVLPIPLGMPGRLTSQIIYHWLYNLIYHSKKPYRLQWKQEFISFFIRRLGFFCFYRWGGIFKWFLAQAKKLYCHWDKNFPGTVSLQPQSLAVKQTSSWVLVVEDHKLIQFLYQEMLIKLGCRVVIASSGREALNRIDKIYDLILLDIGLPDINGIEVAHELHKLYTHQQKPCPRIIALTAHVGPELKAACLAVGIEQVINKPIDLQTLNTLIYPTKN